MRDDLAIYKAASEDQSTQLAQTSTCTHVMCSSRMMCFSRPLSWAAAMALVLTSLLAAGCDGGPTWNETDPAVGPEDPNVVTGTIGSEGGVVRGPDSSAVAAAEGTFSEEIGLSVGRVQTENLETSSLPSEVPIVGDRAYEVGAERSASVGKSTPPAAIEIPVPARLDPESLSVAVKHPRRIATAGIQGDSPSWVLEVATPNRERNSVTVTAQTFLPEGSTYALVETSPVVFEEPPTQDRQAKSSHNPGFYTVCWKETFEMSNPCERLESISQTLTSNVLPEARRKIKDAGYGVPRIDRCTPTISDIGEECSRSNDSYEVTLTGIQNDFSGTGEYKYPMASSYVLSEKEDGESTREPKNIYATARHELLHAYQNGRIDKFVNEGNVGIPNASSKIALADELSKTKHFWVAEAHAELAALSLGSNKILPSYLEREILNNGFKPIYEISRDQYRVQDFWAFISRDEGVRKEGPYGLGFSITRKVLDKALVSGFFDKWTPAVEEALEEEGVQLSNAYWLWIRDQMYEGMVMGRNGAPSCDASPVRSEGVSLEEGVSSVGFNPEDIGPEQLPPLSSGFKEVRPQWSSSASRDISIELLGGTLTDSNISDVRMKTYIEGRGGCASNGQTGLRQEIDGVSGDETVYVLVSNTAISDTKDPTLFFGVSVPTPRVLEAQSRDESAYLTWEAPEGPPSSFQGRYNVYRSTSEFEDPSEATPVDGGIGETSFTDTGLENGQTYYYRVTANYKAEEEPATFFESAPTSQVEVKPLPEPPDRP